MSSHAILIPVHKPKAHYLINLLHSYQTHDPECGTDMYLVCSDASDCTYFSNLIHACMNHTKHMHVLNCSSLIQSITPDIHVHEYFVHNHNNCVVNFKKFVALWHMSQSTYEFVTVIDADAVFIKHPKVMLAQCQVNYLAGRVLGSQLVEGSIGIGPCVLSSQLLTPIHQTLVQSESNQNVYHWFSEPPTYHKTHLKQFFQYMVNHHNSLDNFLTQLNWFTFDYLVYVFWMVASQNFQIINYNHIIPHPQVPELWDLDAMEHIMYAMKWIPSWVPLKAWLQDPVRLQITFPSVGMLYHMDRP